METNTLRLPLPSELLEMVFNDVDLPADLLALALTCRTFHKAIVPSHLCYRQITVYNYVQAIPLWDHIIASPILAANIRSLVIGSHSAVHAPVKWTQRLTTKKGVTAAEYQKEARIGLCRALQAMSRLRSLTYRSVMSEGMPTDDVHPNNTWLWDGICQGHPGLYTLDAEVWLGVTRHNNQTVVHITVFDASFCNITRLVLELHFYKSNVDCSPLFSKLLASLKQTRALYTLSLDFDIHDLPVNVDQAFAHVDLLALRVLLLYGGSMSPAAAQAFFDKHRRLELFRAEDFNLCIEYLSEGVFSSLRSYGPCSAEECEQLARIGAPRLEELIFGEDCELALLELLQMGVSWARYIQPLMGPLKQIVLLDANEILLQRTDLPDGIMLVDRSKFSGGHQLTEHAF